MYFSRVSIHQNYFKTIRRGRELSKDTYTIHQLLWRMFSDEKKRPFIYREEIAREQLSASTGARGEPVYYIVSKTPPISDNSVFRVESKEYQPKFKEGDKLTFSLRANPVITKNGNKHDVVMNCQHSFLLSLCEKLDFESYLPSTPHKRDFKNILISHGGEKLDDELTHLLTNDFRYADRLQNSLSLRDKLDWTLKAVTDQTLEQWMVRKGNLHGFHLSRDTENNYCLQNTSYYWNSLTKKAGKQNRTGFSSIDFTGEIEVMNVDIFLSALFNGIGRSKAFGCSLLLVKRR